MDAIALTRDDIFRVLRSILFAELKRIRKNTDLQFDESLLSPDVPFAGLPGGLESQEAVALASAALSFFALDGSSSPEELAAAPHTGAVGRVSVTTGGSRPAPTSSSAPPAAPANRKRSGCRIVSSFRTQGSSAISSRTPAGLFPWFPPIISTASYSRS